MAKVRCLLDAISLSKEVILMDGGFSEELSKTEVKFQEHPGWTALGNFTHPHVVQNVYEKFLLAGCRIITANTYHHCPSLLQPIFGAQAVEDAFKNAVALAKTARNASQSAEDVIILTSIGPYAATLRDASEYTAAYAPTTPLNVVREYYEKQLALAQLEKSDGLLFETIPSMLDLAAILQAAKDMDDIILSFTLDGLQLRDGTPVSEAVQVILTYSNVVALGINCCDPDGVLAQMEELQRSGWTGKGRHVIAYPNPGGHFEHGCWNVERSSLDEFVPSWTEAGVNVIGGCCGVGVRELHTLKNAIDQVNKKRGVVRK